MVPGEWGTQRGRWSRGMLHGQRSPSVPREERGPPRQQVKHEAPGAAATEGRPVSSAAAVGEAVLSWVDPPVPSWRMRRHRCPRQTRSARYGPRVPRGKSRLGCTAHVTDGAANTAVPLRERGHGLTRWQHRAVSGRGPGQSRRAGRGSGRGGAAATVPP